MRRREGARARRERRQRAEALLVRDAARFVAHRGGPHFGSQSKCVMERDGHASHGVSQCPHTLFPLVGRHVFVLSGVPALRPPILDGGVVFGGGACFSSMLLESAVGSVSLLDPGLLC